MEIQTNKDKIEWIWSTAPVLLPLAYEKREWNAVYIAFFLAEYSGAPLIIIHVKEPEEDVGKIDRFIEELNDFALDLGVKYTVEMFELKKPIPSVSDIANVIVQKSDEYGAQAVVMSAHRETFFRELFGRVSDNVARRAKCRVVLVETPHLGLIIPKNPRRILIPVIQEEADPEAFIIAAALTSSASIVNVEIVAAKIVVIPPTLPLDAFESTDLLREIEKDFSESVGLYIKSLGKFFTPRLKPVRELGPGVTSYANEIGADLIILSSKKPAGYRKLVGAKEYEVVSRASCIVLVVFPRH